jgi:hypothetical protein
MMASSRFGRSCVDLARYWPVLRRWHALPILLLLSGCAALPNKGGPELAEQMRTLTELRDTCMQYGAWVAREFSSEKVEYRRAMQLYIEASSVANSYIESVQFDLIAGVPFSAEHYEPVAARLQENSTTFLQHAREALQISKSRGFEIVPLALGLIELASKLNDFAKAASQQQRDSLAKALEVKKWKQFQDLTR